MQRVMKQDSESAKQTAQAKFTSKLRENESTNGIADSPAMVAQRKKLQSLFGGSIQRVEDDEPLQGKFDAVQRVEEEEPLQGKFETVQRAEEEEPLQGKFEAVQRVEEEEPLQGKFEAVQRVEEEEPLQGKFEAAPSTQLKEEPAAKPNNTGLPDNLKSGIENLSGMSMDNVKVHYNSSQPAQLNALAYAQGTDIHVAPRQEQHLPHEAWHVVQQAQGRVKPTMQMKEGVPVNDDKSLEHEADVMGARAATVQSRPVSLMDRQAAGMPATQLKSYQSAHVTLKAGWDPNSHPWPGTHGNSKGFWAGTNAVKGTDVNGAASKLCRDVEKVTEDLSGTKCVMGSPHMAPKRMGGKGDVNNVRPWTQAFESSNWHGTLDNQVKSEFSTTKAGTTIYEDVETDESHKLTTAWLKPLQDRHDGAAGSADKTKLAQYITHVKGILDYVPDGAKINTPGGSYAASGSTFDPQPINPAKAKGAFATFNGGDWDKVIPAVPKDSTVKVTPGISGLLKTMTGITLAVGAVVTVGYLISLGLPLINQLISQIG